MKRTAAILVLSTSACFSGCSSHQKPTLTVRHVGVSDRTEKGFVLKVEIEAENRNEIELPLREIRYTVTLPDGAAFSGVRSPEASLRRLGRQTINIPAAFDASHSGARSYDISGVLDYITPGEFAQVLFDTGVRRPSVDFKASGTIEADAP